MNGRSYLAWVETAMRRTDHSIGISTYWDCTYRLYICCLGPFRRASLKLKVRSLGMFCSERPFTDPERAVIRSQGASKSSARPSSFGCT